MKRGRVYNRIYNEQDWQQVNKQNKAIIDDFLMELRQQKKKQSTINQYYNDLRLISIYVLKELDNKSFLELTKRDFRRMSLWFSEELNLSNARINRLLSAVRSMLTFCENDDEDYEDYEVNVARKIKGLPKEQVREIYFLTDEQIMKLREELIRRGKYAHAALLMMAYDSAGRRNELLQVKKEGILERNATNVVVGKRGKKFRLIYFDKECLKLYLDARGEDDIEELWVTGTGENKRPLSYSTMYNWFIDMAKVLSEIEGKEIPFNVHSLRHSALENMSNGTHYICRKLNKPEGFSLNELKVYAHHESVDTTNGYLKNDDEEILSKMFGIDLSE